MGEQKHEDRLTDEQFLEIALFSYRLRRLLKARETIARDLGVEVQQYAALLAIRGSHLQQQQVTMSKLARSLFLKLHSTVELVDRLEQHGLAYRERDRVDLRQVFVRLTEDGDRLARLGAHHYSQVIQEHMLPMVETASHVFTWVTD